MGMAALEQSDGDLASPVRKEQLPALFCSLIPPLVVPALTALGAALGRNVVGIYSSSRKVRLWAISAVLGVCGARVAAGVTTAAVLGGSRGGDAGVGGVVSLVYGCLTLAAGAGAYSALQYTFSIQNSSGSGCGSDSCGDDDSRSSCSGGDVGSSPPARAHDSDVEVGRGFGDVDSVDSETRCDTVAVSADAAGYTAEDSAGTNVMCGGAAERYAAAKAARGSHRTRGAYGALLRLVGLLMAQAMVDGVSGVVGMLRAADREEVEHSIFPGVVADGKHA